jgi:hypothetical protein
VWCVPVIVVVPVVFFFEAAIVCAVNLRGAVVVSAVDERLTVGLVPSVGVVVRGGAYLTIFIARAGVALQGTIMKTSLVPLCKCRRVREHDVVVVLYYQLQALHLSVSVPVSVSLIVGPSGKITACFDVSIELEPLEIQLQARFAYFGCVDMVEVCCSLGCIKVPSFR